MLVYLLWEIYPYTGIKNVLGVFLNEALANRYMEEQAEEKGHGYFYVSEEEVIE